MCRSTSKFGIGSWRRLPNGTLTEGSTLPATRALAADFGINFHTVNKAYDLLRQQGLIRLNRKTGAVVILNGCGSAVPCGVGREGAAFAGRSHCEGLSADGVSQRPVGLCSIHSVPRKQETRHDRCHRFEFRAVSASTPTRIGAARDTSPTV